MTAAAALDLGSTLIKGCLLDEHGRIGETFSRPAPALQGEGDIRECEAEAYAAPAGELLEKLACRCPPGTPLGIASQRSTYLLWDKATGEPMTPMISWQDRRAADWCSAHSDREEEIVKRTGLVLSPHYAGPKLAVTEERKSGGLIGTLESWLLWRWSGGRVHQTDLTMAARTAMLDLSTGDWSPELLELFDVPRGFLPEVAPTSGRSIPLDNGLAVTATIADQASAALSLIAGRDGGAVVTLGTGAFLLWPTADRNERIKGYLTAPILAPGRYVLEGSINGAGNAVDRFGKETAPLEENDPAPDAFCMPDSAGWGAPFWLPELGLVFSDAVASLDDTAKRRTVVEGILFRVRQLLDDLSPGRQPRRILLSGGLSRDPFVAEGLAALLGGGVELPDMSESTLAGIARLAAGLPPYAEPAAKSVEAGPAGAYLRTKYLRWRRWLNGVKSSLDTGATPPSVQ
jgi:glycerol kinase